MGHDPAKEHHCREAVQEFFQPFPVSRFFVARVRDIIQLLPRFAERIRVSRLARHPEYKYGRELFVILGHVCGWPEERFAGWPPPQDVGRTGSGPASRPSGRRAPRTIGREVV